MAKQLVNPLERHVEKVVLGITGILFLGATAKYLVTSPNKVELGPAGAVSAKSIDEKVVQKAEAVRQSLRDARPRVEPVDPLVDDFAKAVTRFAELGFDGELAGAQPVGPAVPLVDVTGVVSEKINLVNVVPVPKPLATTGRLLTLDPSSEGGEREVATDWVTVSTVFDLGAQNDLQLRTYGSRWREVYFAPAQLQRRQRRADTTWSDDDWKDIDPWPAGALPDPPDIPLVADGKNIIVPKDDYRNIEKYFEFLSKPGLQVEFLRPKPPHSVTAPTWKFPVITSLRDVAMQDDYFLYPEQPKSGNPRLDRYPWLEESQAPTPVAQPDAPKRTSPRDAVKEKFAEYEAHMKNARENKDPNDALRAYNVCIEIQASTFASPSEKQRARRLADDADQLSKDLRLFGGAARPGRPEEAPKVVKRDPEPKQQIWAHDAEPGSLQGGQFYQYRIRAVVVNRLAGAPEKFQNPSDAKTVFLTSPWSAPTDPVYVEPAMQYYLDGVDRGRNEATLEVFLWFRGVWVTDRFKLKIGETIDAVKRRPTPDPDDPTKVYQAPVPFQASFVVADIDYERRARERKVDRNGFRFMPPDAGGGIVLMDPQGRVEELVAGYDRGNPDRKTMKDQRVWKPPPRRSN